MGEKHLEGKKEEKKMTDAASSDIRTLLSVGW